MLFLLAAGLTLVFGIMDTINLAHDSLCMFGAYLTATLVNATGSLPISIPISPVTRVGPLVYVSSWVRREHRRTGPGGYGINCGVRAEAKQINRAWDESSRASSFS
ncbi:ABC transporter permease subunit [Variovorax robiniae]|uniref:ABC transporter permease subunit n=1 Tax=Variovorax robiniae TaxID=1836199 RepID=UPI003BF572E9